MSNGSGGMGRWMRNILATIALGMAATMYSTMSNRLDALEKDRADAKVADERLQMFMCIVLDEVYDLQERVSGGPVFRRQCP